MLLKRRVPRNHRSGGMKTTWTADSQNTMKDLVIVLAFIGLADCSIQAVLQRAELMADQGTYLTSFAAIIVEILFQWAARLKT